MSAGDRPRLRIATRFYFMQAEQSMPRFAPHCTGDFMNASNERMSVFGPTLRFKGELKAQEDIKIEGRIEGTIHHQQRVVVGAKGEVVAAVNAASIDVDGKVQGDMVARKSVKVSQSAIVRGNIRAPSVSITEGANFNGGVTMESNAGSQGSTGASR